MLLRQKRPQPVAAPFFFNYFKWSHTQRLHDAIKILHFNWIYNILICLFGEATVGSFIMWQTLFVDESIGPKHIRFGVCRFLV